MVHHDRALPLRSIHPVEKAVHWFVPNAACAEFIKQSCMVDDLFLYIHVLTHLNFSSTSGTNTSLHLSTGSMAKTIAYQRGLRYESLKRAYALLTKWQLLAEGSKLTQAESPTHICLEATPSQSLSNKRLPRVSSIAHAQYNTDIFCMIKSAAYVNKGKSSSLVKFSVCMGTAVKLRPDLP